MRINFLFVNIAQKNGTLMCRFFDLLMNERQNLRTYCVNIPPKPYP